MGGILYNPFLFTVNGTSKVLLPLMGTVLLSVLSEIFASNTSKSTGHLISGSVSKCIFPSPVIVTKSFAVSSVVKLSFCNTASIVKLPTAPLKPSGFPASGKGFTFIIVGLVLNATVSVINELGSML